MPLTDKGKKIMRNMKKEYGAKKGKEVFYASQNKGTIKGTHKKAYARGFMDKCAELGVDPEKLAAFNLRRSVSQGGMGLAGAGTGAMLGIPFGPVGMAVGAGLGGLLGAHGGGKLYDADEKRFNQNERIRQYMLSKIPGGRRGGSTISGQHDPNMPVGAMA